MKRINRIIVLTVAIFFCFTLMASAGWFSKSHNEKAQEFIKARMFDKAIEEMEKEIDEHPTNAEAHFQLGILYFHKQSYGRAKERFTSAYSLEPRYGPKIGTVFKQAGNMYLNRTFISRAINNYRQALRYDRGLRDNILEKCFQKIIFLLNPARRLSGPAESLAAFIQESASVYNEKIKAVKIAYARQCLQIAKKQSKNQRQPYLQEAKKYLTQKEINKVIPPPSWKTVFVKEFVGVGFTGGDEPKDNDGTVHIAELGKTIQIGDKTIIETYGNTIQIWDEGRWQDYRHPITNRIGTNGYFVARAKKGEKFKVTIKRFQ